MADSYTPHLNLTRIGINESEDTWGNKLNDNADKIDAGVKDNSDDITALDTRLDALEAEALRASFIGEIRIYSGALSAIPNIGGTGSNTWRICDGTNGTPNLISKFVMGAGGSVAQGTAGGAASWTGKVVAKALSGLKAVGKALTVAMLPAHKHNLTINDPGHKHAWPGLGGAVLVTAGGDDTVQWGGNQSPLQYKGFDLQQTGTGITITMADAGVGDPHEHDLPDLSHDHSATVPTLPPYLAYAYIRRMK
jgi:hypothetical protein